MRKSLLYLFCLTLTFLFSSGAEAKWPAGECYNFSKGKMKRKIKRIFFHAALNKKIEFISFKKKNHSSSGGGIARIKEDKPGRNIPEMNFRMDPVEQNTPDPVQAPLNQGNLNIDININIEENTDFRINNNDNPPVQQQRQIRQQRTINNTIPEQQLNFSIDNVPDNN